MNKFKLEITETLQKVVEIEAEDINKALQILKQHYYDEEYVLDETNYISTDFNAYKE